eukprot:7313642-Pyramimonas_sp.AAC.1
MARNTNMHTHLCTQYLSEEIEHGVDHLCRRRPMLNDNFVLGVLDVLKNGGPGQMRAPSSGV